MAFLTLTKTSGNLPAQAGDQTIHFFRIYYKQDRSLSPYLLFSCLFAVGFLFGLLYSKDFLCFHRENKLSQVIDIELVSPSDFKDKKNLLPATVPKPSLAKRTSPAIQSKGQLFSEPVFIIRAGKQSQHKEEIADQSEKQAGSSQVLKSDTTDLSDRYVPLSVPFTPISHKLPNKGSSAKKTTPSIVPMDMQEIKPPELMEVKENEGDNSYNYWQDGGSSTKGTGISSSLAEYLKDLHSKLKHAWSPPPGTIHHIKVIFRLNKNGHLISIQLTQSSGNIAADDSALLAIKNSAPFGKLPSDYTAQFLDLAYTFNYTTDELHEIHQRTEE